MRSRAGEKQALAGGYAIASENIERLDFFSAADPEAFQLSLDVLFERGYVVARDRRLYDLVGDFDKLGWSIEQRALYDFLEPPRVHGQVLVHVAMHALVASAFGHVYPRRARTTLVSEALAGALEPYYELACVRRLGLGRRARCYARYEADAERLRMPFRALYDRAVDDPFAAYQAIARAEYRVSMLLFEHAVALGRGEDPSRAHLEARIREHPEMVFLRQKDFGNFVAFALGRCGARSDATDVQNARRCLQWLSRSRSMPELMRALGGQRLVTRDPKRSKNPYPRKVATS